MQLKYGQQGYFFIHPENSPAPPVLDSLIPFPECKKWLHVSFVECKKLNPNNIPKDFNRVTTIRLGRDF